MPGKAQLNLLQINRDAYEFNMLFKNVFLKYTLLMNRKEQATKQGSLLYVGGEHSSQVPNAALRFLLALFTQICIWLSNIVHFSAGTFFSDLRS